MVTRVASTVTLLSALTAACGGSSHASANPTAPSSGNSSSAVIASFGTIPASGSYSLSGDLTGQGPNCVTISVPNVTLDCAGHHVSIMAVENASNVTISHCSIGGTVDAPAPGGRLFTISKASQVTVRNCELDAVKVTVSQHVTFDSDHIIDQDPHSIAAISVVASSFVTVSNSSIDHFVAYGISLGAGHDNIITNNIIDGALPGSTATGDRDDGVSLDGEQNDMIAHNTIMNVPDAGIEGANAVTDTTIEGNTMQGIGFAGVGSYYETSWHRNTIRGNQVSGKTLFLEFENLPTSGNVNTPLLTDIGFADNVIENNVSRVTGLSPGTGLNAICAIIHFEPNEDPVLPIVVGNNVIRGNDFGAETLVVAPASAFIDGGGNTCGPSTSFVCR